MNDTADIGRSARDERRPRSIRAYPEEHGPRTGETVLFLHGGNMGGWTWAGIVDAMPDRHLLTPDLPGYGHRAAMVWPGVAGSADDVARIIRERAVDGRAHVVGLSLGGHVAMHLLARHPDLVRSCIVSGVTARGLNRSQERSVRLTVPLWHRRWFWRLQSYAFGIPADARRLFVDCASAPRPETNRLMFDAVRGGAMPDDPIAYSGPFLAVAGERESAAARRGLTALQATLPQAQTWIAPKMHHAWSAEDPELFSRMVETFAESGRWP